MSLILTEISNAGIAMVADSSISMRNPVTGQTEPHKKDWLKILKVPRIHAAVAYWGNIGAVSGAEPFDQWLTTRIRDGAYTDLPSFANFLATELNTAAHDAPLPHEQCVGIHVAGYHPWQDNISRPTFYHVLNGDGHIAIRHHVTNQNGQQVLTRIDHQWIAEPRRLFYAHLDYPSDGRPLAESIAKLEAGYITRNGDYFPYLLISDGINFTQQTLQLSGISLPANPDRLGSRLGYLSLVMQTVIAIYGCSSLTEVVGGYVTALGITRNAAYLESTRKTKFPVLRALRFH
jgi:hypothetical protein